MVHPLVFLPTHPHATGHSPNNYLLSNVFPLVMLVDYCLDFYVEIDFEIGDFLMGQNLYFVLYFRMAHDFYLLIVDYDLQYDSKFLAMIWVAGILAKNLLVIYYHSPSVDYWKIV